MAQQTAVEWLSERLIRMIPTISPMYKYDIKEYVEQAKAIEKEQMYQVWKTSEDWSDGKLLDSKKSFEEYYNETYSNGKKN